MDECFYRGNRHPVVETVGELKEQLARLPEDLPIASSFVDGVALVVFNRGTEREFLGFGEPEDYNELYQ